VADNPWFVDAARSPLRRASLLRSSRGRDGPFGVEDLNLGCADLVGVGAVDPLADVVGAAVLADR
jgi:hypothetical protein